MFLSGNLMSSDLGSHQTKVMCAYPPAFEHSQKIQSPLFSLFFFICCAIFNWILTVHSMGHNFILLPSDKSMALDFIIAPQFFLIPIE